MNGNRKGKVGEREFAKFCKSHGFKDARRSQQYCGNTGEAADVVGLPGVHVEVKRVEALNVDKAMDQAVRDAAKGGDIPIVAHRKNRRKWLITMLADDWMTIYKTWNERNKLIGKGDNNVG